VEIPYDGPQGRTWQINWGLNSVHSFRAPTGTLDRRRPVFAAIARSFRPNPAWQQRLAAVNAFFQEQFNQQLQAGYDQIAAAGQLSRQISANNDAMLAAIDSRLRASRAASNSSSGRSANDKFSDYIRGVETVDDPYYGTSQHSNTETYHWTDGYGTYRHSNDPSYNPNASESSGWQLMTPTR
jgi:curved DNA-binding protein CbpA